MSKRRRDSDDDSDERKKKKKKKAKKEHKKEHKHKKSKKSKRHPMDDDDSVDHSQDLRSLEEVDLWPLVAGLCAGCSGLARPSLRWCANGSARARHKTGLLRMLSAMSSARCTLI